MDSETISEIKKRIGKGESAEQIRNELVAKGFLEEDVNTAVNIGLSSVAKNKKWSESVLLSRKFTLKEVFDRIGFGFGSMQYLNILFRLSGASYSLIGLINGLRTFLGVAVSSFLDEHRFQRLKDVVFVGGILYAASFLIMSAARYYALPWLFSLGLVVGGVAIVLYGNSYQKLLRKQIRDVSAFLEGLNKVGLVITAASLMGAAFILNSELGYVTVFWITAAAFVIGSFSMIIVREEAEEFRKVSFSMQLREYFSNISEHLRDFVGDRVVSILLVTGTVTSFVQTLGYSYYGIFIYEHLGESGFGRYLNVAVIFLFALLGTFIGSFISKRNAKEYGKFPMLTFGTLLMAIMPLTFFYNPTLTAMSMATILGVVGSCIVGVARSILTVEIIPERKRAAFFKVSSVVMTLPYVLAIPAGAFVAEFVGLRTLFFILAMILIAIVVPLYFTIVLMHHKKRKI